MMIRSYVFFLILSVGALTQCKKNDYIIETPQTINLSEVVKLKAGDELDFITEFQFSSDEALWIGTFNNGVYHVSGDQITNYNSSNSQFPNNRINDIFIDYKDRVWVATNDGFAMYQNNVWEVYDSKNTPLLSGRISQIAVNENDEVIIGKGDATTGGLLLRSQNGSWIEFTTQNSKLPCSYILEIELSQDNNFWISTGQFLGRGGIAKLESQEITTVHNIESSRLLYNWVDNIEVAHDQLLIGFTVFIFNESGFPEGGIQRLNIETGDIQNYFPNTAGEISNRITALKLHSDNSLWFTTILDDPACDKCFSGIGRLSENNEFIIISSENSELAPNAYFPKLEEDGNGDMYVASDLSIYRLELR